MRNIQVIKFEQAAFIAVLLFWGLICTSRVVDLDLWRHLKAGENAIQTHTLLASTDTGWIFDVAFAAVYKISGIYGVQILKTSVLIIAAVLFFLLLNYNRLHWCVLPLLILVFISASPKVQPRPEVFSLLLIGIYLHILERFRKGSDSKTIYLLPLLQLIWVNTADDFVIGMAITGIYYVDVIARAWIPSVAESVDENTRVNKISKVFTLTAVILFMSIMISVNPCGNKVYHLFSVHPGISSVLGELRSPFIRELNGEAFALAYKIWILVSLSGFILRRKIVPAHLGIYLIFLILSLRSVRNIPFFVFTSLPITAENYVWLYEKYAGRIPPKLRVIIKNTVIAATLLYCITFSWQFVTRRIYDDISGFGLGLKPYYYITGAADYVRDALPSGRIFNDINSSGYLFWRLSPKNNIFVDNSINYYLLMDQPQVFDRFAQVNGINIVVMHHGFSGDRKFIRYLWDNPAWEVKFLDYTGIVFTNTGTGRSVDAVRNKNYEYLTAATAGLLQENNEKVNPVIFTMADNVPEYRSMIELCTLLGYHVDMIRISHYALLKNNRRYDVITNLAIAYSGIGDIATAKQFLQQSLKVNKKYGYTYYVLGNIAEKEGDVINAEKMYKRAVEVHPFFQQKYEALAELYLRVSNISSAREVYLLLLREQPGNTALLLRIADLYLKTGNKYLAKKYLSKAFRKDSGENLYLTIGNIYESNRYWDEAYENYLAAEKINPSSSLAAYGLGRCCYSGKKDFYSAVKYYEKALELGINNKHDVIANLGRVYFDLGEKKKGVALLRQSIELFPRSFENWVFLGRAYENLKEPGLALDSYRRAAELNPQDLGVAGKVGALTRSGRGRE
ncbi:MAG: tetratricopeptide repeat protein [Elusimicrobiota bacterium]